MPRITFIEPGGKEHVVDAESGQSLMQAAAFNHVLGIVADCGGNCSCGTCHVYIGREWAQAVPKPAASERAMLGIVALPRDTSRLSCCIAVTAALEGLVVNIPDSQY
jgi:2Fe-2S ferredoxin